MHLHGVNVIEGCVYNVTVTLHSEQRCLTASVHDLLFSDKVSHFLEKDQDALIKGKLSATYLSFGPAVSVRGRASESAERGREGSLRSSVTMEDGREGGTRDSRRVGENT